MVNQGHQSLRNHPLTVITKFAMINWILAKGELLQIRIGLSKQADNKHARARGVQCGHSLDCLWLRVTRVDDDDGQRDDIHPNGLQ